MPEDGRWDFARFYDELAALGIVIYPGKLTTAECFRLGTIGRIFPQDVQIALLAIRDVLARMGVALPVTQQKPASDAHDAKLR